ncbi:MAG: hypothetical protein IJP52_02685 [Paludibacteraceae bacterium]|nr:hypothetical protein [Paludibacteraceae bacterium]
MKQSLFVTIAFVFAMLFVTPVNAQRLEKQDSYYTYGGRVIEKSEISSFLKKNCQEAYEQYHNKQLKIGWGVCVPSMAILVSGAIMSFSGGNSAIVYTGIGFGVAGAVGILTSVPFLSIGYDKRRGTCAVFNNYCAKKRADASIIFDLKMGPQSLGLAVNF